MAAAPRRLNDFWRGSRQTRSDTGRSAWTTGGRTVGVGNHLDAGLRGLKLHYLLQSQSPAGGARRVADRLALGVAVALLTLATGCAVPQPRGAGQLEHVKEPSTNRGYWRYLPASYVKADAAERGARRWPVVVTFHGMKPFDNARPQALEWELEADRYGYIVIAPQLRAPDVLAEFPVRNVHPAFKSDEEATLAILAHVFATTQADPANVLSTSWSSGGYMAHYMVNRHPDRFTCLAVRQSNFSSSILDPAQAGRSFDHPILILNTQNDFAVCIEESREAREWYKKYGYKNLAWVYIRSLGHERTPDLAADFFGRVAGVEPLFPPTVLATRQAIDGNDEGIAFLSGRMSFAKTPTGARASAPRVALATSPDAPKTGGPRPSNTSVSVSVKPTPQRPVAPPARTQGSEAGPSMAVRSVPRTNAPDYSDTRQVARPENNRSAAPRRNDLVAQQPPTANRAAAVPSRPNVPRRDPLGIRVNSAIAIEPLHLNFSAECPAEWYNSATFNWTLAGEPIGSGVNGQKTIAAPGEHLLSLLVVTADGQEHRSSRTIRVIPRLSTASASSKGN
jgi:hypothetical protein